MKKMTVTPKPYEAPSTRYLAAEPEQQFVLSMTNGFIYDAEDNEEYWYF